MLFVLTYAYRAPSAISRLFLESPSELYSCCWLDSAEEERRHGAAPVMILKRVGVSISMTGLVGWLVGWLVEVSSGKAPNLEFSHFDGINL